MAAGSSPAGGASQAFGSEATSKTTVAPPRLVAAYTLAFWQQMLPTRLLGVYAGLLRRTLTLDLRGAVGVAQLVELLVVVQAVGGSSPLAHPS